MTDFSLMLPTFIIFFSASFLVLVAVNQGNMEQDSNSRKSSQATDSAYLPGTVFYDEPYQYHPHHGQSSVSDHSGGVDFGSGGDFGGFDGGSH